MESQFDKTIQKVENLNIKQDSSILIAGQRRSGKTVLCINLLLYLTEKYSYQSIILFSDTGGIETNSAFDFIDKNFIFESRQLDEIIPKLMKYQEKEKKKNKQKYMIIVLDDINLNKRSKLLDDLYSKSRHYNIMVITLVQYSKIVITNIIRSNIDILFMSKQNNSGLESMYECINTELDKREFYRFIRENTINNQFVFYNLHDNVNKLKIVKADFFQLENKGKKKQKIKL
uniref:Putative ATPase n=1 Tax=Tetrahymena thermophila TaxID=5911 RepID=Q8WRB3_TETTH|nr:putative ATPase [Tetrahymena thermophila]